LECTVPNILKDHWKQICISIFFFKFDGRESITLGLRNGFWSMWITVATMCFSELGGIGWHWVAMGSATGFSLVEGMGQFKRM